MRSDIFSFDDVMDRVRSYLEQRSNNKAVHEKDIAAALGMRPAAFSNAKKRNSVPLNQIVLFCARHRISINWVLYGQHLAMLDPNAEDAFMVRLLEEVRASAGGGALNDEVPELNYLRVDPKAWHELGLRESSHIEAIRITGDSMEPTLYEGELILVDRVSLGMVSGEIYVVNTPEGVLVKKVFSNHQGAMDLVSENPNYSTTTYLLGEASVIGKVVGVLDMGKCKGIHLPS